MNNFAWHSQMLALTCKFANILLRWSFDNYCAYVESHTPCVPLQLNVPNKVQTDKNIFYDHLVAFGCKALIYIPIDERSKLNVTTMCFYVMALMSLTIVIWSIWQKLSDFKDVVFMEDQTILDIHKTNNMVLRYSDILIDLDPIPLTLCQQKRIGSHCNNQWRSSHTGWDRWCYSRGITHTVSFTNSSTLEVTAFHKVLCPN